MTNEIKIRQAKPKDIEAISTIKVKGWQNAYRDIIDNEYLDNMNIERVMKKNRENLSKQNFIVAEMNQNEANQLINKLRNNTYKVKGFTDEYLKQFQNDEKMRN